MERLFTDVCWDNPTKQDYLFTPPSEYGEWDPQRRPRGRVIVWDQWNSPACVWYSGIHIVNWYNILEDDRLWSTREQINPWGIWIDFCKERWYSDKWTSIQDMANYLKRKWLIQWRTQIPNHIWLEKVIDNMKKAIDMWYFLHTGSSNWDWTKTRINKKYTLRTDRKFVWHGFSIVDYDNTGFIAINSRWPDWCDSWYFHIPFELSDKLYSKLVYIDKDDTWWFQRLKDKEKAKEGVRQLKKIYDLDISKSNKENCWKIATELRTNYWFTDKDL